MLEKNYGIELGQKALQYIKKAESVLPPTQYTQLHDLFERTLLTTELHAAVAAAYFGHRIYLRGAEFQTAELKQTITVALAKTLDVGVKIEAFKRYTPVGQWNWHDDAKAGRDYHTRITAAMKL